MRMPDESYGPYSMQMHSLYVSVLVLDRAGLNIPSTTLMHHISEVE